MPGSPTLLHRFERQLGLPAIDSLSGHENIAPRDGERARFCSSGPRKENRAVVELGAVLGIGVISGGDRHGLEANAVPHVLEAASFEELVRKVREKKRSEIVLMPQNFEPLPLRLVENAWHALSDVPGEFGQSMRRVFIEHNGEAKGLSEFTGTRFHRVADKFRWVISLVRNPVLRPALRLPFLDHEEGGL